MAIKIAGTEVINDDRELVLAKLAEIDTSIADTAVDVFVYDTSKDSDGGALQKEGSGDDYEVAYNGFTYTVEFSTAPANGNDVGIIAEREDY